MSEPMTETQQAAAFHGLASNPSVQAADRFAMAMQALDLYEAGTEVLLARVAELEAERDEALDRVLELITACDNFRVEVGRLSRADVAAEVRGYDRAVANLRDYDAYKRWATPGRWPSASVSSRVHFGHAADYLEATKESTP